jgi:hypothetical protein
MWARRISSPLRDVGDEEKQRKEKREESNHVAHQENSSENNPARYAFEVTGYHNANPTGDGDGRNRTQQLGG